MPADGSPTPGMPRENRRLRTGRLPALHRTLARQSARQGARRDPPSLQACPPREHSGPGPQLGHTGAGRQDLLGDAQSGQALHLALGHHQSAGQQLHGLRDRQEGGALPRGPRRREVLGGQGVPGPRRGWRLAGQRRHGGRAQAQPLRAHPPERRLGPDVRHLLPPRERRANAARTPLSA